MWGCAFPISNGRKRPHARPALGRMFDVEKQLLRLKFDTGQGFGGRDGMGLELARSISVTFPKSSAKRPEPNLVKLVA